MRVSKSVKFLPQLLCLCCLSLFFAPITVAQESDPKSVYWIAVSGDQRVLGVTYGSYQYRSIVDLFDTNTGELLNTVDLSPLTVGEIALSPTGDRLFFANSAGDALSIYDTQTGVTELFWSSNAVSTDKIGWNPVNDEIAYELGAGLHILDAITKKEITVISTGEGVVSDFEWSWDGKWLATSSYTAAIFDSQEKRIVKIWDLSSATDRILSTPYLKLENRGGGSVAWSPDGTKLAVIEEMQLLIYDVVAQQI